mmetsp:Transcript_3111/g.6875  ORF Transcript_3111/g.6875 Transcript_3111/m.6875 type:complete len:98 (-) Transcript_3111:2870-3163(-)
MVFQQFHFLMMMLNFPNSGQRSHSRIPLPPPPPAPKCPASAAKTAPLAKKALPISENNTTTSISKPTSLDGIATASTDTLDTNVKSLWTTVTIARVP